MRNICKPYIERYIDFNGNGKTCKVCINNDCIDYVYCSISMYKANIKDNSEKDKSYYDDSECQCGIDYDFNDTPKIASYNQRIEELNKGIEELQKENERLQQKLNKVKEKTCEHCKDYVDEFRPCKTMQYNADLIHSVSKLTGEKEELEDRLCDLRKEKTNLQYRIDHYIDVFRQMDMLLKK